MPWKFSGWAASSKTTRSCQPAQGRGDGGFRTRLRQHSTGSLPPDKAGERADEIPELSDGGIGLPNHSPPPAKSLGGHNA
jgi:hypothetical protein